MKRKYYLISFIIIIIIAYGVISSKTENKQMGYSVEYLEKIDNGIKSYEIEENIYKYLITLSGRSNNATYDIYYVVLTNNENISFKTVNERFYGSNMMQWDNFYIVEFGFLDD